MTGIVPPNQRHRSTALGTKEPRSIALAKFKVAGEEIIQASVSEVRPLTDARGTRRLPPVARSPRAYV